jgi:NitT/TauT family transport system substrate-binding protein
MKKIISLLCALTLLLLVCSCGSDTQQSKVTTVRVNEVAHSVFYAPQYVAMKKGFFQEEGIAIELTNGGGADKVMTAVLTDQADIGLAGPEACIYVYNQGKGDYPKVFAQLTKRDGSFLVGRTNAPFSWSDLRGKTIIGGRAGGVPEMTLEYVMRHNGVEPHVDAVVDTSVQFNMMAGAFTGGNGDYVALFEPTATEVEQSGHGYILASIGQESGEIPYTAYFASQTYMKDHSDVIQRFTNAIAKGQKWVQEHSPQEIAEAIADQFPDTDVAVLATVAQRYRDIDAWNTTPVMEQESLERLETVMEQAGELKRSDWVVFEELVDNSYAKAAG